MMAGGLSSYAQTLNDIPISELDAQYIQIMGTAKALKPFQVTIRVDYGQMTKVKDYKKGQVLDEDGKPVAFNGMMGVVNFFAEYDYILEMAYPVGGGQGGPSVYHYIMKKSKI